MATPLILAALLVVSVQVSVPVPIDRIVAVVDDEPILRSELDYAMRTSPPVDPLDQHPRRTLDQLIDQMLRSRDARRHEPEPIAAEVLDRQLELARSVAGSRVNDTMLRVLLERQLRVSTLR